MNTNCKANNSNFSLNLRHQAIFSVLDASKVRIGVAQGSVWITLDNDSKDYILEECGVFTTAQPRRAVVYALQSSCITVSEKQTSSLQTSQDATSNRNKGGQYAITFHPGAVHSPC